VVSVVYAIYLHTSIMFLIVFVFAGVHCMVCLGLLCSDVSNVMYHKEWLLHLRKYFC
jgi:hypothetical protein